MPKQNYMMKKGVNLMNTTAIVGTASTSDHKSEPVKLRKRIGSTVFLVNVHFSETSAERLEDKILRMMEREVNKTA